MNNNENLSGQFAYDNEKFSSSYSDQNLQSESANKFQSSLQSTMPTPMSLFQVT
jgi:hypothetical protein